MTTTSDPNSDFTESPSESPSEQFSERPMESFVTSRSATRDAVHEELQNLETNKPGMLEKAWGWTKTALLVGGGLAIAGYFAGPWLAGLWGDLSAASSTTGSTWWEWFAGLLPRGTNVAPPLNPGYGYGGPPVT